MNLSDLEGQAAEIVRCYEYPKAAMLPLLWLVQQNQGYVSPESEAWVGRRLGVSIAHVPYRGGGPSLTAALSGEVQLVFSDIVPAAPLLADNRLNGLAMTGLRRAAVAPGPPTALPSARW